MKTELTRIEENIVSRLHGEYESLTKDAKAELARRVSWAESHIWTVAFWSFVLGGAACYLVLR